VFSVAERYIVGLAMQEYVFISEDSCAFTTPPRRPSVFISHRCSLLREVEDVAARASYTVHAEHIVTRLFLTANELILVDFSHFLRASTALTVYMRLVASERHHMQPMTILASAFLVLDLLQHDSFTCDIEASTEGWHFVKVVVFTIAFIARRRLRLLGSEIKRAARTSVVA